MRLRRLRVPLVGSIFLVFTLFYLYFVSRASPSSVVPGHRLQDICPRHPLGRDVSVVLRTGATEALEKLPIHFRTVLACVADYLIYSDYEEDIEGHHVHDILDEVNITLKASVPEFALYNQLHANGREGLDYHTVFGSGPSGALENPGWKLDKWKFLPMVDRVLQQRPDAKWLVFVESDTYMLWQNVLEYLIRFDATKPHYLGKHMYINNVLFGHGGSGFILSRPAAEKVAAHWREHQFEYDQYTLTEWAGDMILGKALKDVKIDMFWAFPHLQGDSLTTIDWNVSKLDREPWCYAPLTFHHMNQDEFKQVAAFEQDWLRHNHHSDLPRFRDVFKHIVLPKLAPQVDDWDNLSTGRQYSDEILSKFSKDERNMLTSTELEAHLSVDKCRSACIGQAICIQFSYIPGVCSVSEELKLGHGSELQCLEYSSAAGRCIKPGTHDVNTSVRVPAVASGWVMSRVEEYIARLDASCEVLGSNDWVT